MARWLDKGKVVGTQDRQDWYSCLLFPLLVQIYDDNVHRMHSGQKMTNSTNSTAVEKNEGECLTSKTNSSYGKEW